MTFRTNGVWYAPLIGLGFSLVASSSSEPVNAARASSRKMSRSVRRYRSARANAERETSFRSPAGPSPGVLRARCFPAARTVSSSPHRVRNCGPCGALIPLFEAKADGPYAFLNENEFLSSDPGTGSGGVSITFYEEQ